MLLHRASRAGPWGLLASPDPDTPIGCWGQVVPPPPHSLTLALSGLEDPQKQNDHAQKPSLALRGPLPGLTEDPEWARTRLKPHRGRDADRMGASPALLRPRAPGPGSALDCVASSRLVQPQAQIAHQLLASRGEPLEPGALQGDSGVPPPPPCVSSESRNLIRGLVFITRFPH